MKKTYYTYTVVPLNLQNYDKVKKGYRLENYDILYPHSLYTTKIDIADRIVAHEDVTLTRCEVQLNLSNYLLPVSQEEAFLNLKKVDVNTELTTNLVIVYTIKNCYLTKNTRRKIDEGSYIATCEAEIVSGYMYYKHSLTRDGKVLPTVPPDHKLVKIE